MHERTFGEAETLCGIILLATGGSSSVTPVNVRKRHEPPSQPSSNEHAVIYIQTLLREREDADICVWSLQKSSSARRVEEGGEKNCFAEIAALSA